MGGACFVCVFTLNHSALNASRRRLFSGHLSSEAPCFLSLFGNSHAILTRVPPDMAAAAILEIRCKPCLLDNTEAQFSIVKHWRICALLPHCLM